MRSRLQQQIEERVRQRELACSALAVGRRRHKQRRQALAALGERPVEFSALPWSLAGLVYGLNLCASNADRAAYRELLLHLERWAEPLLQARDGYPDQPFRSALASLARQRAYWVRSLDEWRPCSRNPARQFSHLARHLLARYEAPKFLEAVLFNSGSSDQEAWFRHVGQGGSLRTAPGLTAPLTKRMAHHALQAPDICTPVQAVRWGQVLALGGDPWLALAVNKTILGAELASEAQEAWRLTLIHWLVNQGEIEPERVGPIVEFALCRKRRDRRYSLQGRTPQSMERLIEERRLRAEARAREQARKEPEERTRYQYREFASSGFKAGIWECGSGGRRVLWMLDEIRCNRDLIQEGRHMRHCVDSYEDYILAGASSIWSLRVEHGGVVRRAITIEVDPRTRKVIECRGKCNRLPKPDERRILERWARENGLEVALGWQCDA
ncbi:MAG: PcfJ domain-containing protein [Actinomycetota bacterium]